MDSLSKPTGLGLSVDQMYDWYRVSLPDEPAILYLDENDVKQTITREMFWKAIVKGTEIINHELPELQDGNGEEKPMVVGILANLDSPTYTTFAYAHFCLTHPRVGRPVLPFLISTRNSPLGIANLIENTQTEAIWVSDGPMRHLVEEALRTNLELKIRILAIPSFNDLYHPEQDAIISTEYDSRPVPPDTPLVILHSSGSTSFPKPRTLRHIAAREWAVDYERCEASTQGEIIAVSPPFYHGLGLVSTFYSAGSRMTLAFNSPHSRSLGLVSSNEFLKLAMVTEATWMITTPNFLEEWVESKEAVHYLQNMKGLIWGGGPVGGDVGKRLFDQGVPLYLMYGTTETGVINKALSTPIKEGYEYFTFGDHVHIHLVPTEDEGVFQVIVVENDEHHVNVYNTEVDGVPAWNTNDIIIGHPENPKIYRFVGRSDDQIMLSTGQKTNPGPLEKIIRQHPDVQDVLYFGRGRASNGILVQPKSIEKAEELGVPGFRNLIWQSIEEANAYAPAHSRILKEMILITKPSKPFLYTAKETLRKGVVIDAYKEEIEELYKESANSVRAEVPIPLGTHLEGGWTESESSKFVHQVIHLIMEDRSKNMGDDDDIFAFGCDSLLATYIRNTLINGLRQVAPPSNIDKLSTNFVYQSPTINQLSKVLAQTSRFELSSDESESLEARKQRLEIVIKRYTQNWTSRNPENEMRQNEEVVLVTGTTGALGSQMLVQLIDLPTVKKIYAVNRPTGQSLYDRHVSTFTDRDIGLKLLESEKIVFVEGEVSVPGFGVDPQLYEEMRVSVTCIIHNAWRVHFKISLASYESAIRGVRLLVDFALSSPFIEPPKLLFTSSIGNIKPWVIHQPVPESPFLNIDQINTMGYAESKWISERILTIAGDETTLKPVIVRVGQMTGGDAGDWKASEWFPTLVAASQRINSLPSFDGTAAYLLLPTAASAMLELRQASIRFAHLVDPQPALFNDLINIISENLGLPIIPYGDWLKRLEEFCQGQGNNDGNLNLAEDLLDTYKASAPPANLDIAHSGKFEAMGWAVFETTETIEAAPSLRDTPVLGRLQVDRWLAYWRKRQILS